MGLIKLFQLAVHDFGDGLRGFVFHLFGGNFFLFGHHHSRHLVAGDSGRMAGGDLQRDVFDQLPELIVGHRAFLARADFHQHPDFCARMDIAGDQAVATNFHARVAGDLDVLANLGHRRFALGVQIDLGILSQLPGDLVGERSKQVVAGDKVRFAIDLDQHAQSATRGNILGDNAFFGFARGFGDGGGSAFLA